jgi:hypothetical protein
VTHWGRHAIDRHSPHNPNPSSEPGQSSAGTELRVGGSLEGLCGIVADQPRVRRRWSSHVPATAATPGTANVRPKATSAHVAVSDVPIEARTSAPYAHARPPAIISSSAVRSVHAQLPAAGSCKAGVVAEAERATGGPVTSAEGTLITRSRET